MVSMTNVAGMPSSSWKNVIGTSRSFKWNSNFSTRGGLTRQLVQPESSRALKVAFSPEAWRLSSMGSITGVTGPLTSSQLAHGHWLVESEFPHFGDGVSLMTSTLFSAISVACCNALVAFPVGPGGVFLFGPLFGPKNNFCSCMGFFCLGSWLCILLLGAPPGHTSSRQWNMAMGFVASPSLF